MFDFENEYTFPRSIKEVDDFTGKEFELFLFHYFELKQCEPTLTDDTGDRGIDIIIKYKNERIGIQAKRWKSYINSAEITKMLEGKKYYDLNKLWIITTSELTAQAQNTALNNRIRIIVRKDVIDILEEIKQINNVKFTNESTNSTPRIKNTDEVSDTDLYIRLKELRTNLANEFDSYPVYTVFTDKTLQALVLAKPTQIRELYSITGLGETRIKKYGKRIISTIIGDEPEDDDLPF